MGLLQDDVRAAQDIGSVIVDRSGERDVGRSEVGVRSLKIGGISEVNRDRGAVGSGLRTARTHYCSQVGRASGRQVGDLIKDTRSIGSAQGDIESRRIRESHTIGRGGRAGVADDPVGKRQISSGETAGGVPVDCAGHG